jgi:hypothetical protein
MSLIFRKNASRNEKIYTLFLFTLLGLAGYGFFTDFYPKHAYIWTWPTWIVIFFLSALLTLPFFFDSNPTRKTLRFGPLKKAQYYFSAFIACSVIMFGFIGALLPSLYTSAFGQPFIKTTEVIEKSDRRVRWKRGRICGHRIKTDFMDTRICVADRLFYTIEAGDKVIIEGLESGFGHKIFKIRKYRKTMDKN